MRRLFLRRRCEIPLHARIIAAVLAICLLLVGLDGCRTWQARADVIAADKVETANLARSLAQHAHDTLYVVDVILSGFRERMEVSGLRPDQTGRLDHAITLRLRETPMLCGLAVFDAAGVRVAGDQDPAGIVSVADRAALAHHGAQGDRSVWVGEITRSCAGGQWSLTVSRRIDDRQGRFAGIVRARISIAFLRRYYGSLAIGRRGMISLATLGGSIVARADGGDASIGTSITSGTIFSRIRAGEAAGNFHSVSPIDGVTRLGSFRRVDDYPLYILVGHAQDEVLAAWRINAWLHMAVSTVASMLLVLIGSRVASQVRIRQQAERRYRLLADNSSDAIVCISLDGMRRYVSPTFTVLTGWSAEEVLPPCAAEIIHPDDRPHVAAMIPRLVAGAAQATICFRYICKDGSLLWVETRARLLQCDDGEMQIISNVRDITDRRAAEDRVAMLNRELAEQASTDGLTGVANRRRFDEVLLQEWQRARQEGMPLSLLMIDVDRFKLFNDRYGHQRGDECLRAVAAAAAQTARGPSALTARYGGEEFVVLLPCLDAVAAAALAGRVLAATRALDIEHEDNAATGVVTVSIGAATMIPWTGSDAGGGGTALVAAADAALYEAKRGGRDCAVTQADILHLDLPWTRPTDTTCGVLTTMAANEPASAFTLY